MLATSCKGSKPVVLEIACTAHRPGVQRIVDRGVTDAPDTAGDVPNRSARHASGEARDFCPRLLAVFPTRKAFPRSASPNGRYHCYDFRRPDFPQAIDLIWFLL